MSDVADGEHAGASVLRSRISDRVSLDPVGNTFTEWTPTVNDPQWQASPTGQDGCHATLAVSSLRRPR